MFDRFTDGARRAIVLAQDEARRLNHSYIGTEHLLLGLLREGQGVAATALEVLGVSLDGVRRQVEETIGRGAKIPGAHLPFTPPAKEAIERSLQEAMRLEHRHLGTGAPPARPPPGGRGHGHPDSGRPRHRRRSRAPASARVVAVTMRWPEREAISSRLQRHDYRGVILVRRDARTFLRALSAARAHRQRRTASGDARSRGPTGIRVFRTGRPGRRSCSARPAGCVESSPGVGGR